MKLEWLLWLASLMPQPQADQTCLATTIYLEARSEPRLGQAAVAEVAMRRLQTGRWGDNVCSVVNAKAQFAPSIVSGNYLLKNPKAWATAWSIAGEAIANWSLPENERRHVVPNADHFYAQAIVEPVWTGRTIAVIGGHSFIDVN